MNPMDIEIDGEKVTVSESGLLCTCGGDDVRSRTCVHKDMVLLRGLDRVWFDKFLWSVEPKPLGLVNISIPLFTYTQGGREETFHLPVDLQLKPDTYIPSARVVMRVPERPVAGSAGELPGTVKMAGVSYANLGILLKGEGRKSIANSAAAWVGTQLAIVRANHLLLECDGYYHGATVPDPGSSKDPLSILFTGECIGCFLPEVDIATDVPHF